MKKSTLILALCTIKIFATAQPIPLKSIEDSVLGWMKVYNYKGVKATVTIDDKLYSIPQLSICDSFANWIQASFLPRGGWGDVRRMVAERLTPYNQHLAARPQMYGAYAKIYTELKRDANGKKALVSNSHLLFEVIANYTFGSPVLGLCTPSQYYFLMPSFAENGYGEPGDQERNLAAHPVIKKYGTYFIRNSRTGNQRMVLLYKDGKSPFVKITKGEYLQAMEAAVARLYETEKKKIHENPANSQKNKDYFMQYLNDYHARRLICLKNNKEKYKDRLQETAEIYTTEPNLLLENIPDIFEGTGNSGLKIPVYKVDPVVAELCKKDKPQWIVVAWTTDLISQTGKHLYDAAVNNFNFDYVYNFFFDPEKVKGQAYAPRRPQ